MEFDGEFTVDGTPEELWKYFTDPDILQECAPGCQELTLRSPSELTATLAVGVGSVKPSFDVDGVVVVCDRPDRLELRAGGEASRNSFEVSAWQELVDNGDGTTTVTWEARAQVSGIIASMGERALGSVANKLVNDFFADLEACVVDGVPAESRLEAADDETLREAGYLEDDLADAGDGSDDDADDDADDEDDSGGGLMDRLT
jgi:carbon monoxide dehydrogenase subunit G